MQKQWRMLIVTSLAVVCCLTSWFAATAVLNNFSVAIGISLQQGSWLTSAVQLGFVTGALGSSFLALTDTVPLKRILTYASVLAALSTALLLTEPVFELALALRFITGIALAGVYPTSLKLIATWFERGRGFAMGAMVGALTLGSAMPHFVRTIGDGASWKIVIAIASLASLLAAVIFAKFVHEGKFAFPRGKFEPGQILSVVRNKPVMLANLGYFGHMWELYAMWGWILAYTTAAQSSGADISNASLLAFLIVAAGAPGCLLGGYLSDRIGRCLTTILMMCASGACAFAIGFVFNGPLAVFVAIALIWGFTIVADSAQFSTAVSELSAPDFVGSSLAFQMAVGFAITVLTIWLVPVIADWTGSWRWTFLILLPGPVVGVYAMFRLRADPASVKLAGGLR